VRSKLKKKMKKKTLEKKKTFLVVFVLEKK